MNELIAKLMNFLVQESLEDSKKNVEVSGEEKTKSEGKTEETEVSKVDEKATKDSEGKTESVKAQAATVNDNAELLKVLKEMSAKLDKPEIKTESKTESKTDNAELLKVLSDLTAKIDSQSSKKTTKAEVKKDTQGFNPAEPSTTQVSDLAGAIALARGGQD